MINDHLKLTVNILLIVFSSILIIDYIIGYDISTEIVEYNKYYKQEVRSIRNSSSTTIFGIKTDKNEYPLTSKQLYNNSNKGDEIKVFKSKVFSEVLKIEHKNVTYEFPSYSIYKFHNFFPIICFLSNVLAMVSLIYKKTHFYFLIVLSIILTMYLSISIITNSTI